MAAQGGSMVVVTRPPCLLRRASLGPCRPWRGLLGSRLRQRAGVGQSARSRGVAAMAWASGTGDSEGPRPSAGSGHHLALYVKDGCPLCDRMAEKLEAAVAAAVWKPSCLTGATLELRRCEDDPAWGRWELETPMLVRIHANGEEESIPRPSPRCTVAQLIKHLEKHL